MSITLGTTSDLQLVIPSDAETDWSTSIRDNCFQKIVDHDHSGSAGLGVKLTATAALTADSVDDTLIKLSNNAALRSADQAGTGDIDIVKVNTSDKVEVVTEIARAVMINDTYIGGRNNADSTDISIAKVSTTDEVVVGANNVVSVQGTTSTGMALLLANSITGIAAGMPISEVKSIGFSGSFTMADNQSSAANVTGILAATDEFAEITYKITRSTSVQFGKIMIDEDNGALIEEFYGDDAGITFTNVSGQLKYVSTSTGNAPTFKYLMIKG